ncbi:hypothetical protein GOODEAATRI_028220, partial [Goodea atripinnis]
IFWMTGSMLIILLGMLVVPTMGWRWMIRLSITPSIILIFLFKVQDLLHACKERGSWRILLSSSFRRTSLLLWYSWFVASFAYYGSVLSSSELLEKNLLCVMNADEEHQVKHRHESGRCYCIPFGKSDYQTLLISSLGEVACESMTRNLNVSI